MTYLAYTKGSNPEIDRGIDLVDPNNLEQVKQLENWLKYDGTEKGLQKFVPQYHKFIPVMLTAEVFLTAEGDPQAVAEYMAASNEYLKHFVEPRKDGKCFHCGVLLGGMFGSFVFGITHGEGICGKCGWPARTYHDVPDAFTLRNYILQYMPAIELT
jgi:hypothetical protein